ncbi:MAG: thioredoxin domain-containing protein, partial [Halanaerobiaceae bacterium]|nr:thioredoxin domain-containing protein [Halanaerobiaceae bacterium]
NPVDWYPWGEEAFNWAAELDKPVFLSIGYSSCHWCHVMAEESFEDLSVAELINDVFVAVKVDREERPDIDNLYMTVCQLMTRQGGWPLTIIMTPDKKPFFAATYIPKRNRYGRIGLLELIPLIKELWQNKREELMKNAEKAIEILKYEEHHESLPKEKVQINTDIITDAVMELNMIYDDIYGGFGTAPKFPIPHQGIFLLNYYNKSGDKKALEMVEKTLIQMRAGGIYDHLGSGFHRYSTDRSWSLPHFEKMLYDQALLLYLFTTAYQITKKDLYKSTIVELVRYLKRELSSDKGAFYSAEDADSEGEEGKFYLWEIEEIKNILKDDADIIIDLYNVN